MTSSSRIEGAALSLRARAIETSLSAILARLPSTGERPQLEPPKIEVKTHEQLVFEPVRDLALREILAHAKDGRAKATIPLRPTTIRVGPLALTIAPGSAVVADVAVADGRIVYSECRGRVEPPVSLPLGFTFKGIDLDDDGNIYARIGGLPDLNLSRLALRGFKVPRTLADALDVAFARVDRRADVEAIVVEGAGPVEPEKPLVEIDLDGVVVDATGVAPNTSAPLSLGSLGEVSLGDGTRLDILFRMDRLAVSGHVDVRAATLAAEGLRVENLRGGAALTWELARGDGGDRVALSVADARGAFDSLVVGLKDGTRLHAGPCELEGLVAKVDAGGGAPPRFSAQAARAKGAVTSGVLIAHVAHQVVPLRVADVEIEGGFAVAHDHFRVDLDVKSGAVSTTGFVVDVGLLRLDLGDAQAHARGRLRAGTDMGAAFSGALAVSGEVRDGALRFGPLAAGLASGTRATLVVDEVAGGPDGLDALVASGEVRLVVRSGTVPLGPTAQLCFSRGAAGKLVLAKVDAKRGAPFPVVEGSLRLSAQSDACPVDPLLELPAGAAHVAVGRFALDDMGLLVLEDVSVELASDASFAAASSEPGA